MQGPAWMYTCSVGSRISTYYHTAEHQLGVAAPLKWADDAEAQTPAMGGAAWTVSKHTANPDLATDLVHWITTAPEFWSVTPNYPAYRPIANLWQEQVSSDPLFAADPFPVYQAAAAQITPLDKWPRVRPHRAAQPGGQGRAERARSRSNPRCPMWPPSWACWHRRRVTQVVNE